MFRPCFFSVKPQQRYEQENKIQKRDERQLEQIIKFISKQEQADCPPKYVEESSVNAENT